MESPPVFASKQVCHMQVAFSTAAEIMAQTAASAAFSNTMLPD